MHRGEHRAARGHATPSRDLARRLGDKGSEEKTLSLLGQVHGAGTRHQRAVQRLVQAMELFRSLDHQAGESLTLGHLDVQHLPFGQPQRDHVPSGEARVS
ncbi:tetratricopeptide repeat protein [Streptomyces murinus]|uniref:tetratricopeptide repeat protein n=1 Tax=Streptomyces murinus TaxID=33900 RepID=UPI0038196875